MKTGTDSVMIWLKSLERVYWDLKRTHKRRKKKMTLEEVHLQKKDDKSPMLKISLSFPWT